MTISLSKFNPDIPRILALFASKQEWHKRDRIPADDDIINITNGTYSSTYSADDQGPSSLHPIRQYNINQLRSLFRRWRTQLSGFASISRTTVGPELLTYLLAKVNPLDLLVEESLSKPFFSSDNKYDALQLQALSTFRSQLLIDPCKVLLTAARAQLCSEVAKQSLSSGNKISKGRDVYVLAYLKVMESTKKSFIALLPPLLVPSADSNPFLRLKAVFVVFFTAFERAMAKSLARSDCDNFEDCFTNSRDELAVMRLSLSTEMKGKLGRICGWLLRSMSSTPRWRDVASRNDLLVDNVPPECDYLSEINKIELVPGALYRPSEMMFLLVLAVENFCEEALCTDNLLLYGSVLVVKAVKHLSSSKLLHELAGDVLAHGLLTPAPPTANSDAEVFTRYFVHVYARMRGKDYVKRILGRHTTKALNIDSRSFRSGIASMGAVSSASDDDQSEAVDDVAITSFLGDNDNFGPITAEDVESLDYWLGFD